MSTHEEDYDFDRRVPLTGKDALVGELEGLSPEGALIAFSRTYGPEMVSAVEDLERLRMVAHLRTRPEDVPQFGNRNMAPAVPGPLRSAWLLRCYNTRLLVYPAQAASHEEAIERVMAEHPEFSGAAGLITCEIGAGEGGRLGVAFPWRAIEHRTW